MCAHWVCVVRTHAVCIQVGHLCRHAHVVLHVCVHASRVKRAHTCVCKPQGVCVCAVCSWARVFRGEHTRIRVQAPVLCMCTSVRVPRGVYAHTGVCGHPWRVHTYAYMCVCMCPGVRTHALVHTEGCKGRGGSRTQRSAPRVSRSETQRGRSGPSRAERGRAEPSRAARRRPERMCNGQRSRIPPPPPGPPGGMLGDPSPPPCWHLLK